MFSNLTESMNAPTTIPPAKSTRIISAHVSLVRPDHRSKQVFALAAMLYRRSFEFYTEQALLTSVAFYAAAAVLFSGAFLMRYRMGIVFAFPTMALLMAVYFNLSFSDDSPLHKPEKLYREPAQTVQLVACCTLLVRRSFVNLPWPAPMYSKSGVH